MDKIREELREGEGCGNGREKEGEGGRGREDGWGEKVCMGRRIGWRNEGEGGR